MITAKPADLIVTPETAMPVLAQQLPEPFALAVRNFADSTAASILFGAIGGTITPEGRAIDYTNSLFGITPGSLRRVSLRQASPRAVRRIRAAGVPLVREPDGHSARRFLRAARRCRSRSSCTTSRSPSISATRTFSAKRSRGPIRESQRRPACWSTRRTSPGSATPSRSTSICRSRGCARSKPAGRCCARPIPA